MATRTIRFDPAKERHEYDIVVECDVEKDEIVWVAPPGATALEVKLKDVVGEDPDGVANDPGPKTIRPDKLERIKKNLKSKGKNEFQYSIRVTYGSLGFLFIDPTVKILP